jgi:hypothetical protein
MMRRAWIVAAAGILLGSALFADQAVVKTRDGETYTGEIQQRSDSVIVTIHGVDTVIPKNNIASIEAAKNYDDEFHDRMLKLSGDDVAGRITLAREAFGKGKYELAREAAESARAIDPNNAEAAQLLDTLQSQMRMERAKAAGPAPTVQSPVVAETPSDRNLLTTADVETIRRAEFNPNDPLARIRFDGDVKKQFADARKIPFADFNALSPAQQAVQILANGNPAMREKVQVLSDPPAMIDFRKVIQPLVLQNCATVGCHGSPGSGAFLLVAPPDNDSVTYTNFYILQSYVQKTGGKPSVFGSNERRLIDRSHGAQSLLAMYGLPAAPGQAAHPLVNGKPLAPIFQNLDDPRYRLLVDWIDALPAGVPDYGIRYAPPATTQLMK